MSGKKLVIVESPTKARTIRKFLTKDFMVESCMGHIRDLPQSAKEIPEKYKKFKWAKLGVNVDEGFEPLYCVPKNKTKVVKNLKDKLKEASELILATDEDREGESISWHLIEVLKPKVPIKRMVFHEITKEAITQALENFRNVDQDLVKAQEARRILDRLVGYSLSPLLWKKVAYGLSAGRVQSVAVRLISEKEHERIRFKKSKYSNILAGLEKDGVGFDGKLSIVDGKKVASGKDFDGETGKLAAGKDNDFVVLTKEKADAVREQLSTEKWVVSEVEEKPITRRPLPPFITSTLQQESNRKLGLSSRETMQMAQKLYEQGYITYMRTDSTFLSNQALEAARHCIESKYGKEYLPEQPKLYTSKKVKGAQEAHEAIRPAGTEFATPEETGLSGAQLKLYDLIWKRTVASQMVEAKQKQVSVKFSVGDSTFTSSGMTIVFPGFLRAYVEGHDDPEASLEDREVRLPHFDEGQSVDCKGMNTTDHETKPPARFTEASLVQTMEKEGIGRPSTYAAIIGTIIDRGYVRKAGNALVPTFTALVVSQLLSNFLTQYVDLKFTSDMESALDDIADGDLEWEKYLKTIYFGASGLSEQVLKQEKIIVPEEARQVDLVGMDKYRFRIGRYGAYVCRIGDDGGDEICASLPDTQSPADMTPEVAEQLIERKKKGNDSLGKHPELDLPIFVLAGRYGPYVQLGDAAEHQDQLKRIALPANLTVEDVTLEQALWLLTLPRTLGTHPESQKDVKVGIGRFGPYVVHDGDYRSVPKTENLFDVDMDFAMNLLAQPKRVRGRQPAIKEFGTHPDNDETIALYNGPYGHYVKCGRVNAALPEGATPDDVTLEMAMKLLEEKGGVKKKATRKKAAGKKTAKKTKKKTKKKTAKKDSGDDEKPKTILRRKKA